MLIDRILDPVIVILVFAFMAEAKPAGIAKARHLIPSVPGLVPVYIRPGDTPLQEINQDLADAFDFNAVKHGRLAFGKDINAILNEQKNKDDFILQKENFDKNEVETEEEINSHIQKIPRYYV